MLWRAVAQASWPIALCAVALPAPAHSQPRPDAGTLQEPQRLLPALPTPGEPRVILPPATPPDAAPATVRIIPTEFRLEGNRIFATPVLAQLLASRVNQPTDLAGLQEAARQIKAFYQTQGYLLTDVYVPQQALRAEGGPVVLTVVEAHVGDVTVRVQGSGTPAAGAYELVRTYLRRGDPVTADGLDKPVLLLRDLAGHEAVATVEPGAQAGLVNVLIDVRAAPARVETSLGLDNHGTRAAGATRVFATLDAPNLTGNGDTLSVRAQLADPVDTRLLRLSYSFAVRGVTRANLSAARTGYALGRQFAALGARGRADVLGASALHPLIRSRTHNLYLSAGLEHKQLHDETHASPATDRRILTSHAGVLGNFTDGLLGGAFNSYAARLTAGTVRLDDASLAADQGPGGPRTAGQFTKLNIEAQRTQFWPGGLNLQTTLQGQIASKNLASAEKMSLGGPSGVRGYPVGEAVGDSGAILGLELRYPLPATLAGAPVSLAAFYDVGTVTFNQQGNPLGPNQVTLDSAGVGLLAGRAGDYLLNASLAWRIGSPLPSGGEPDRSPRLWLTTQKWF